MYLLLLLVMAESTMGGSSGNPIVTNWGVIGASFETKWSSFLPPVPEKPLTVMKGAPYLNPNTGPFQKLDLSMRTSSDIFCGNETRQSEWPRDAIKSGPLVTCGVNAECCDTCGCNNNACNAMNNYGSMAATGNQECKASAAYILPDNNQPIALRTRHFTSWGKIGPQPAYR